MPARGSCCVRNPGGPESVVEDLGLVAVEPGEEGLRPGPEQEAVHHLGRRRAAGIDGGVEDAEEGGELFEAVVRCLIDLADLAEEARQDAVEAGPLEKRAGVSRLDVLVELLEQARPGAGGELVAVAG